MKKVKLIVRQSEISKVFPNGAILDLEDNASIVDAIKAADLKIIGKCGSFPVKKYESLLQMVYHPRQRDSTSR